ADCTYVDADGRNAFHYLASNLCNQTSNSLSDKGENNFKKFCFQMAQILLDHKCNPLQMDNKYQTSLMLALELNSDINHDGKTILHFFAMNCDHNQLVQTLISLSPTNELKNKWVK
ncbi:unnamed protein product, partial [Rotaria sordida]